MPAAQPRPAAASADRVRSIPCKAGREKKNLHTLDDELDVAVVDGDPELAHIKEHYRGQLREALAQAAASLTAEERIILRQHHVDGATIDELARLYGIHRATAARRVASARDQLLRRTHRGLMNSLKVDRAQLESIMALVASQLHASLPRLLS